MRHASRKETVAFEDSFWGLQLNEDLFIWHLGRVVSRALSEVQCEKSKHVARCVDCLRVWLLAVSPVYLCNSLRGRPTEHAPSRNRGARACPSAESVPPLQLQLQPVNSSALQLHSDLVAGCRLCQQPNRQQHVPPLGDSICPSSLLPSLAPTCFCILQPSDWTHSRRCLLQAHRATRIRLPAW